MGRYVSDEERREPGPPPRGVCAVGWDAGCPARQAVLLQPIQATSTTLSDPSIDLCG